MVALIPFFVVCIWMSLSAIGAPAIISASVTRGTNAVANMVGAAASVAAYQAANAIGAGSRIVGAASGKNAAGVDAGAKSGGSVCFCAWFSFEWCWPKHEWIWKDRGTLLLRATTRSRWLMQQLRQSKIE